MNINNIWQDISNKPLEYVTLVLAVLGAAFSSDADQIVRGAGFFLWIFSNGYLLLGFIRQKSIPYSILFVLYEIFNIRGVWNNWLV